MDTGDPAGANMDTGDPAPDMDSGVKPCNPDTDEDRDKGREKDELRDKG
jgi:hypothetical protein